MLDILRKQGVNTPIELVLKKSDNTPYDLTDALITSQIRSRFDVVVADLVVSSNDPTNGRITIETGDTSNWAVGKHEWDIVIEFGDGKITCIPDNGVATWEVIKTITK